jgi:hypothetical protein
MANPLGELVSCWIAWGGIDARIVPDPAAIAAGFPRNLRPCPRGAPLEAIIAWERRHGIPLPAGLRAWLRLSDGLFGSGPLIHPIAAIGPMNAFDRVPGMIAQPEGWLELGNPAGETICIDAGNRQREGNAIFSCGERASACSARKIARSFEEWLLKLLGSGGRKYWFEPGFTGFDEEWQAHSMHASSPGPVRRLRPPVLRAGRLLGTGARDRF